MRASLTMALTMGLVLAMVHVGAAQDRNDQRRQFFEGILRTLIESQVDRGPRPDNGPRIPPGGRNPQLEAARQTLDRFSDESGNLLAGLRQEEQVNPAYRAVLGDMVRIKADADVLRQRAAVINAEQFSNDYSSIDRQWRVVSHRLRQIPSFDRGCLGHVEKLNVYDQQICDLLGVTPQFDRLELARQIAEMRAYLQTLLEDLAFDARRQPGGQVLVLEGQKLLASVDHLGQVVAQRATHPVVVAEYQQFFARWRGWASQSRAVDDRHIGRNIRRIHEINDAIHELLWIPKTVDRGELLALVKTLQRDFDYVYAAITLDRLLRHPNPQNVVAGAASLNGSCANLVASLAGQTSLDELVWDFRTLEVEWQSVGGQFASWREPELDQRLAAVQRTMDILSQTLGQELTIDHRDVVALAASIHEGADSLALQMSRLVNVPNQYPPQFRASSNAAARDFQDAAHHFHESIARGAADDHLKRDCLALAAAWQAAQQALAGFNPTQRGFLDQICQPLAPQIAKVQVLYAY